MEQTITLQKALQYMDTGNPFSIAFVTADKKKHKGGEWVEINEAVKHEFLTRHELNLQKQFAPATEMVHKNPNHYQNSTRNLRIIKNAELRKTHIRLITMFNGMIVT